MTLSQTNPPHEQWLDGTGGKIFTRHWRPPGDLAPKAALVICHGVNSHGGQYLRAAEEFAAAGFAVTALDLRGRGLSEAGPDLNYSLDTYAADVAALAAARCPLASPFEENGVPQQVPRTSSGMRAGASASSNRSGR